mmetsp:Transcript_1656/g.3199  ORF Transcript_1656/g.3199 Transcript_1656/m.3199 type:complete len:221 (-) Transcript_1656:330-992(-)
MAQRVILLQGRGQFHLAAVGRRLLQALNTKDLDVPVVPQTTLQLVWPLERYLKATLSMDEMFCPSVVLETQIVAGVSQIPGPGLELAAEFKTEKDREKVSALEEALALVPATSAMGSIPLTGVPTSAGSGRSTKMPGATMATRTLRTTWAALVATSCSRVRGCVGSPVMGAASSTPCYMACSSTVAVRAATAPKPFVVNSPASCSKTRRGRSLATPWRSG